MKSERVVGSALKFLIEQKNFQRNEFFISSKGGFLHEDADLQIEKEKSIENFINNGKSKQIIIIQSRACVIVSVQTLEQTIIC